MNAKKKRERAALLETARKIAVELRTRSEVTGLSVKWPTSVITSNTNGWIAEIGRLGRGRFGLEVWLDGYVGHQSRGFYAGFYSAKQAAIRELAEHPESPLPVRTLTDTDVSKSAIKILKAGLRPKEFNAPILEDYRKERTHYFGFYDPPRGPVKVVGRKFVEAAVAFFLDVAGLLPDLRRESSEQQVDPQVEGQKWVKAHLARERSRYLALACKRRDHYNCQVCGMTFSEKYGEKLGGGFAEAHHVKWLANAPKNGRTRLEDLRTVCANCHRMLHRMDGKPGDVAKLSKIFQKHQRNRG